MNHPTTQTTERNFATNESVMRALGISNLGPNATAISLIMKPGKLPLLTVEMLLHETGPADHLSPPFNLQADCDAAMARIKDHIDRTARSQWAGWQGMAYKRASRGQTEHPLLEAAGFREVFAEHLSGAVA